MSRLEDLTVGSSVSGLVNNQSVQIVAVKWYGTADYQQPRGWQLCERKPVPPHRGRPLAGADYHPDRRHG